MMLILHYVLAIEILLVVVNLAYAGWLIVHGDKTDKTAWLWPMTGAVIAGFFVTVALHQIDHEQCVQDYYKNNYGGVYNCR